MFFSNVSKAIYIFISILESGEYKLDDGWDGIKRGYYGVLGNSVNNNTINSNRTQRNQRSIVNLVEAQPERKLCC